MISFGELRKFSTQWQTDIAAVERVYVTTWVLQALYNHGALSDTLVLRGGGALRYAYSPDFPMADDPAFLTTQPVEEKNLRDAFQSAATVSGLTLSLVAYERGAVRIEYTGPLGRRSAAQPRVVLSLMNGSTRLEPSRVSLVHPFSETIPATLRVMALDEWLGEHIAACARTPRARDVFDLWFGLMKLHVNANPVRVRDIAQEKLGALINPTALIANSYRDILERAWDKALPREHPSLTQVEKDLSDALKIIFES